VLNIETIMSGANHDYRGSNMGDISAAHQLAQEHDTRLRNPTACMTCGKQEREGDPVHQLCSRCKSAVYCSRECQKEDWKNHKGRCKKLVKERERKKDMEAEALAASGVVEALAALKRNNPGDIQGEAKEAIRLFCTTDNKLLQQKILEIYMGEDKSLNDAVHADEVSVKYLYDKLQTIAEEETQMLRQLTPADSSSGKGMEPGSMLLTWHAVTNILKTHRGEADYIVPSSQSLIKSYSADRSALYFKKCWPQLIDLGAATWYATNNGHPKMLIPCKALFRIIPACLLHNKVARAVFESHAPFKEKSPSLRPLIAMLDLKDKADDLEGLTNQVAALLVVQAKKNSDLINALALERAITHRFIPSQKAQWKGMSLKLAEAIVSKGRELQPHEFNQIIRRIGVGH
jgi:hypothetical protein